MNGHSIYIDMDGVFVDFHKAIFAALNYPHNGTAKWPFGHLWDIFPAMGSSWEEANKHCTSDFWANLSWIEDGREIFNEIFTRFRPNEIMLLTAPMDNVESYTGKARWVAKHTPELYTRFVPTQVAKHEFAHDFNCLLIDDRQNNHEKFTKAGGACILVPRPWNANEKIYFAGETVSYVGERIDQWMELVKHPARNRKE